MKRVFCSLLTIIFLSGCQKVVEVDLPTASPRLVIDATFSTYFEGTQKTVEGAVKLSLSGSFYETDLPLVHDATVFMTDLETGEKIEFSEMENTGNYLLPISSKFPEPKKTYELTVLYANETYIGRSTLVPTVPIDSLSQGDVTLLNEDEKEVTVAFTDNGDRRDFYLFDLDYNLFLTTNDQFYQGQEFSFSFFYEDLEPGEEITVRILGVDEQFYNYMEIVIDQSGQNERGPFSAPPAAVRGNMVNATDPDNYPLGYFEISQAFKSSLVVE